MRSGIVHWARPDDELTACGKVALLGDGTRLLETDLDLEQQVNCKTCLRISKPKEKPDAHD